MTLPILDARTKGKIFVLTMLTLWVASLLYIGLVL